jgi:DNA-binding NarL/FixJ family response regulator
MMSDEGYTERESHKPNVRASGRIEKNDLSADLEDCNDDLVEKTSVLYITRDKAFYRSIRRLLNMRGIAVVQAGDALDGALSLHNVTPNLVLADLDMSGLNGFDIWKQISTNDSDLQDIPFVFLAGMSRLESRRRGRTLVAEDFVMKSEAPRMIVDLVCSRIRRTTPSRGKARATDLLSLREREVITWLAKGKTRTEVAKTMGIKPRTVTFHIKKAQVKLSSETIIEMVVKAVKLNLTAE